MNVQVFVVDCFIFLGLFDMEDIISALGICVGLLSIVGSIVSFVYYLSANEKSASDYELILI